MTNWIKKFLDSTRVHYEERHHPDVFTASQVAEKENMSPDEVAKVVVAYINEDPIGLVLPASRRVNFHAIERIAGSNKVRLASELEMETLFPDCDVGAIPPFNHWRGINFWMDSSMETASGEILIQAGTHHDAIRMRYHDWYDLVKPRVEHFAFHKRLAGDVDEEENFTGGGRWAAVH